MMKRLCGLYILGADSFPLIYGPEEQAAIKQLVDFPATEALTCETIALHSQLLADVDVIFSGWGAPTFDAVFLDAVPRLKAIFYGAGATGSILTEEVWKRGISISSAYAANAVPVAEYCLSMILFSLKHGWHFMRATREARTFPPRPLVPGAYGSTVGLISMGVAAKTLRKLLNNFDLNVIAYDPFMSPAEAKALNIRLVPLDMLFRQSDVVSIHTPLLPETRGLITGEHIASMKPGATLINTSRGDVVRQSELVEVVAGRDDLQIILDVTSPEPPTPDCAIFDLPNVIITPHIAGSLDGECRRMGQVMVEELQRFVAGQPLLWSISPELAARTSHRPAGKASRVAV